MTLVNRLTLFFVVALAVVLLVFSGAILLVTRWYLTQQTERALRSGLNTLVAAIEVVPEGVEWEPAERNLVFAKGPLGQDIQWLLVDRAGRRIDGSPGDLKALTRAAGDFPLARRQAATRFTQNGDVWIAQQWLVPARLHPERDYFPDDDQKLAAIGVAVAIDAGPIATAWRSLAVGLFALSLAVWLIVLLSGQRIARRVLRPLVDLADSAAGIDEQSLRGRLPLPDTHDELERLAVTLNRLLDRLGESMERQRRFTGDAAHQLRTPLTSMLGQAEVALRRERSPDEYADTIRVIHRQARHLHDIVESLLFLARSDHEGRLRKLEPLAIGPWLREYAQRWRDEHPDVNLRSRCDVDACCIGAQPVLLGELLNLLLDNAARYGDPQAGVDVVAEQRGERVRLSITNVDPSLSADELERLFEPFHRSASARARGIGGVGLGLSIARRLAAALEASLAADCAGGRVTFSLELGVISQAPVDPAPFEPAPAAANRAIAAGAE